MLQPKRRSTLDHQKKCASLIRQQGMIKTNQCYAKVYIFSLSFLQIESVNQHAYTHVCHPVSAYMIS